MGNDGEDIGLVRQVAEGSEGALASLYDRHATAVFRLAMSVNRDRGVAEEVVQETFLALWNRAELYDPALGSLVSWLLAIARNRAIDRVRGAARRVPAAPFSALVGDQPDEAWPSTGSSPRATSWPSGRPSQGPSRPSPPGETQTAVATAATAALDDAGATGDPPRLPRRTVPVRDRREARLADRHRQDAIPARPAPAARDPRGPRRGRGAGPAVLRGAGRLSRDAAADARAR